MKKLFVLLVAAPFATADTGGAESLFEDLWVADSGADAKGVAPSSDDLKVLDDELTSLVGGQKKDKKKSMTKTIGIMIKKTMIPSVLAAHRAAQWSLNNMVSKIRRCRGPSRKLINRYWARTKNYRRVQHVRCRRSEAVYWRRMYSSGRTMHGWRRNMKIACRAMKHVKGNPAQQAKRCRPGGGQSYGVFVSGVAKFFKTKLRRYQIVAGRCSRASRAFKIARHRYNSYRRNWINYRRRCNTIQVHMEKAYCSFHLRVRNACRRYTSCWRRGYYRYRRSLPKIRKQEAERKVQWRVLKRVQCLLPIMKKGGAKAIANCRKIKHSTKHLNLKYPKIPTRKSCGTTSPMPCSTRYLRAISKGVPGRAAPRRCNRCRMGRSKKSKLKKKKSKRRGLRCPRGTHQIGRMNSDVRGCGLTGCAWRYRIRNIAHCAAACRRRRGCLTFTWAPRGGDKNHRKQKVCTLNRQIRPNSRWGPFQIMCGCTRKIRTFLHRRRQRIIAARRARARRANLARRRRAAHQRRVRLMQARRAAAARARRLRALRARQARARAIARARARALAARRRSRYTDRLHRGRYIRSAYGRLVSRNRRFQTRMQGDGNIVVYSGGRALWHSHTWTLRGRYAPYKLMMQRNGNVVMRDKYNRWWWHAHTGGKHAHTLIMQGDSNLVVYGGGRRRHAKWARTWNAGYRRR